MFKSNLRNFIVTWGLSFALAGYMAMIKRITRWSVEGQEHIDPIRAGRSGLIFSVWHGRFFLANSAWHHKDQPASVVVSKSKDGQIIASAAGRLGLGLIRGSSKRKTSDKDRGGSAALRGMVKHIKADGCVFITPDGPRGPRMRAQMGAITLAKMTGAPLMPCALSTRHRKLLKSWDRFLIPLPMPFGRGAIVWGAPIYVDRRADSAAQEDARLALEISMNTVTHRADALMGHAPLTPSDTPKVALNDL